MESLLRSAVIPGPSLCLLISLSYCLEVTWSRKPPGSTVSQTETSKTQSSAYPVYGRYQSLNIINDGDRIHLSGSPQRAQHIVTGAERQPSLLLGEAGLAGAADLKGAAGAGILGVGDQGGGGMAYGVIIPWL